MTTRISSGKSKKKTNKDQSLKVIVEDEKQPQPAQPAELDEAKQNTGEEEKRLEEKAKTVKKDVVKFDLQKKLDETIKSKREGRGFSSERRQGGSQLAGQLGS